MLFFSYDVIQSCFVKVYRYLSLLLLLKEKMNFFFVIVIFVDVFERKEVNFPNSLILSLLRVSCVNERSVLLFMLLFLKINGLNELKS